MDNTVMKNIVFLTYSFFSTYALIPIFLKKAYQIGFLDRPDGVIKKHEKPVPYMGGIAVYAGLIIPLIALYVLNIVSIFFILGITILVATGLIDDLKNLRPRHKLFGQFIAVLFFLCDGLQFSIPFIAMGGYCAKVVTIFWMLLVINAFNLIDIMDGLCTLVALIAGFFFLYIAFSCGDYATLLLMSSFIGTLLAFFVYNKPPAKIYLGDAGSLLIGGFLSAVPLLISWHNYSFYAGIIPIVILAIPLMEVFFLVVIRTYLGIPFYLGSPHHFALYLQGKNWRKEHVLFFIFLAGIFLGLTSVFFVKQHISFSFFIGLGVFYSIAWCVIIFSPLLNNYSIKKKEEKIMPALLFALTNKVCQKGFKKDKEL